MAKCRWLSLRAKLLVAFIGMGGFVVAMLILGTIVTRDAEKRHQQSVAEGVKPLVSINLIQSQVNRVRMLEIELLQMSDYFAVTSQLDLLRSEQEKVAAEMTRFLAGLGPESVLEARGLEESWRRYQNDLQQISNLALAMRTSEVRRFSTFDSVIRFKLMSRVLQQLADQADLRSAEALRQATVEYDHQRQVFLLVAVPGLMAMALWLFFFARSTTLRLVALHDAAGRIATGNFHEPVELGGSDELADLAKAFNAMQQQLLVREQAVAAARDELEHRVEARTRELNDSNLRLTHEIAERSAAREQLRLLSLAVEQTPVSVFITDVDGRIQYVNRSFIDSTGYSREEAIGQNPRLLKSGVTQPAEYARLWETILAGRQWEGEFQTRRRDGSLYWEHVHISPVADADGRITHFLAIRQDISGRRAQEELIRHQAHYDNLTGLPNRLLTMDRLSQALHGADRSETRVVLMFVDLDDFKKVNDTLGHEAGDGLLIQAARRLQESVRGDDTVGRQGGDEFLVIMSGLALSEEAEVVALRIIEAFQKPFVVAGQEAVVSASIGLAVYPDDATAPAMLLRYADLAMYDAKESGRNMYRYFDRLSHERSGEYLEFEGRLRAGLANQEFWIAYQPLVDAVSGKLTGVEALLRWTSRDYGVVPPDRFIPVAERSGFIDELGRWVLERACAQARSWLDAGYCFGTLSVNVSPRQFRGAGLLEVVRQSLSASGLRADLLQIEITEGVLVQKHTEVAAALVDLDALGVRIALDDFGTGYSSLSYLKRFPFHTLKIDREFVRDLATDEDDRVLVRAAIHMGKALGLSVVAEGVETREQAGLLAEFGCDVLQGYLYDRPLLPEGLEAAWLGPGRRVA